MNACECYKCCNSSWGSRYSIIGAYLEPSGSSYNQPWSNHDMMYCTQSMDHYSSALRTYHALRAHLPGTLQVLQWRAGVAPGVWRVSLCNKKRRGWYTTSRTRARGSQCICIAGCCVVLRCWIESLKICNFWIQNLKFWIFDNFLTHQHNHKVCLTSAPHVTCTSTYTTTQHNSSHQPPTQTTCIITIH